MGWCIREPAAGPKRPLRSIWCLSSSAVSLYFSFIHLLMFS